jgi:hypothetical protein
MPTHFDPEDFEQNFPTSADVFPTAVDHDNYVDALLFNSLGASIEAIEDYLILWKTNLEAPCNPITEHVYGVSSYTGSTLQISIDVSAQASV